MPAMMERKEAIFNYSEKPGCIIFQRGMKDRDYFKEVL